MKEHRSTNSQTVIVIGGTGMLRPAVRTLVDRGETVLAASRRPNRGAPSGRWVGEYIPVEGRWAEPEALIGSIRTLMDERDIPAADVPGAIVWVHTPYRQPVLDQFERVLSPDATVLQLWGSAVRDPREVMAEEGSSARPWRTRHLFLGYQRNDDGGARWLTAEEISTATVHAWDSADSHVIAGQIDPWEHRP